MQLSILNVAGTQKLHLLCFNIHIKVPILDPSTDKKVRLCKISRHEHDILSDIVDETMRPPQHLKSRDSFSKSTSRPAVPTPPIYPLELASLNFEHAATVLSRKLNRLRTGALKTKWNGSRYKCGAASPNARQIMQECSET